MRSEFLESFYDIVLPAPNVFYPACQESKSRLKLLLQIATCSRLKQGQDKKHGIYQIFYCKARGKNCFLIQVDFSEKNWYRILTNYLKEKHLCGCEVDHDGARTLKVYNLMMLKRGLIEGFMAENGLMWETPQVILQAISGGQQYFYCKLVKQNENRRKLKKRFDNIVNISIKKRIQQSTAKKEEESPKKSLEENTEIKNSKNMSLKKQPLSYKRELSEKEKSVMKILKGQQVQVKKSIFEAMAENSWLEENQSKISLIQRKQPNENDILDDLFDSIKSNLFKSLEKKSLRELEDHSPKQ